MAALVATVVSTLTYLMVPVIAPPRERPRGHRRDAPI